MTAFKLGQDDKRNGRERQGSVYFLIGSPSWNQYNKGYDGTQGEFKASVALLERTVAAEYRYFGAVLW